MRNKLLLSVVVTIFTSLVSFTQTSTIEKPLTLDDCITIALENFEGIKLAEIAWRKSKASVNELLASAYPQIDATVNYAYNPKIRITPLPDFISPAVYGILEKEGLIPGGNIPTEFGFVPAQFGVAHNTVASITVEQLLFDGTFFLGLKAAKVYIQLSEKQLAQAKIEHIARVAKAYYSVLVNDEQLTLATINTAQLDTLLRHTSIMYANGFSEKIDVDRIKVAHNNAITLMNSLPAAIAISKKLLLFQMGLPVTQPITLSENLAESKALITHEIVLGEINHQQRIEYSILMTQKELAFMDKRRILTGYIPTLYLNINYGTNTFGNKFGDMGSWNGFSSIALDLKIPVFDGFRKKYQIEQKVLEMQRLTIAEKQLENAIALEQHQTYTNFNTAVDNLKIQEDNMSLAKNIYNLSKIKYRKGVGTATEVVTAETAYKEAENNYYIALFNALVSKVDFEIAQGTLGQ